MPVPEQGPYTQVSDNDGHRYVIPAAMLAHWDTWLTIPPEDERSWKLPVYAKAIDGRIIFPSYTIV